MSIASTGEMFHKNMRPDIADHAMPSRESATDNKIALDSREIKGTNRFLLWVKQEFEFEPYDPNKKHTDLSVLDIFFTRKDEQGRPVKVSASQSMKDAYNWGKQVSQDVMNRVARAAELAALLLAAKEIEGQKLGKFDWSNERVEVETDTSKVSRMSSKDGASNRNDDIDGFGIYPTRPKSAQIDVKTSPAKMIEKDKVLMIEKPRKALPKPKGHER